MAAKMGPLTEGQINSFIEKIGEVFDIPLFTEKDANRLVDRAKESVEWESSIKEELANAGLPNSIDQIPCLPCNPASNDSILSLQTLAPLFALHNLNVSKENLTALIDKIISGSKNYPADCINYTAPFPRDLYNLDEVRTLRPEYLVGTWFNRRERPFKVNMELDWVNRMSGNRCFLPATPMSIRMFASTGDQMWDFISEVHIHRTAMMEFTRPKDGWIEAPALTTYKNEAPDQPLNFIERMMNAPSERTIVQLHSGTGGFARFEPVRNSEVTAAAAILLFRFSDPNYCARSDGKVVIRFKDPGNRCTFHDKSRFPNARTLVNNQNKFPVCIQ